MAVVTGLTAARMLAIEAASVVTGEVVGNDLILTKFNGTTMNAGSVRGPAGFVHIIKNTVVADYTLTATDINKSVESDLATALIITVPANVFTEGDVVELCRYGAGTLTITPGAGLTMPNRLQVSGINNRQIFPQMGVVRLRFRSSTEAVLKGDLA